MHHAHAAFSSEPSPVAVRLGFDVRVRWTLGLTAILAVTASNRIVFGLLAWAVSVIVLAAMRVSPTMLLRRMIGPLALAALVFLARALLTGTTPISQIDLGFCRLTATREGLLGGALIASRVLGALGVATVLCRNTSIQELSATLHWARVPDAWIEIAVLMHRYLHLFADQAVRIVSAQKVRLGYSGCRQSFRSAGSLAGMVILHSLDQAQRSHEAMTARGYRGFLPLPSCPPLSRRQTAVTCVGVAIIAAAYALAERWPL